MPFFSLLPPASDIDTADQFLIVQGGVSHRVEAGLFLNLFAGLAAPNVFESLQTFEAGCVVANNSAAYRAKRIDGSSQRVLMLNDVNNLDIDPDRQSLFLGIGCTVVMRYGTAIAFESYDLSEDLGVLGLTGTTLVFGIGPSFGSFTLKNTEFRVQTGYAQSWVENTTKVMQLSGSVLSTRAGLSNGPPLVTVGGSIFDDYADASTTHTDGTEDDLFTHTVAASSLSTNGDALSGRFGVVFVGHPTATRKLKLYFGGTAIFDTTALVSSSNSKGIVDFLIERVSPTVVRYAVNINAPGLASNVNPAVGELTGLTLGNANILKVTGAAAATGAASADIVAKVQKVRLEKSAGFLTFPATLLPDLFIEADVGTLQSVDGLEAILNDTPIGSWLDQGLNANNLIQATLGKRPLLKTNYQNGLPAVLFDGINDALEKTSGLNVPVSIYLVGKNVSAIAGAELIGNQNLSGAVFFSDGSTLYAYPDFGGGIGVSVGTTYTFKIVFNGASSSISLNGGSATTFACGAISIRYLIGGLTGQYINFAYMSVLMFGRILPPADDTSLLNRLRTKWGHY